MNTGWLGEGGVLSLISGFCLFVCSLNASRPFLDSQRARSRDDICTSLGARGTRCGNDRLYKIAFNLKQQPPLLTKLCVCQVLTHGYFDELCPAVPVSSNKERSLVHNLEGLRALRSSAMPLSGFGGGPCCTQCGGTRMLSVSWTLDAKVSKAYLS